MTDDSATPPDLPPDPGGPAAPGPDGSGWASPGFAIPFRGEATPAPAQPATLNAPTWPPPGPAGSQPDAAPAPEPESPPEAAAANSEPEEPAQSGQDAQASEPQAATPEAPSGGSSLDPDPAPAPTPASDGGPPAPADEAATSSPAPPAETPAESAPEGAGEAADASAAPPAEAARGEAAAARGEAAADTGDDAPAKKLFDAAASPWQGPSTGPSEVNPLAAWTAGAAAARPPASTPEATPDAEAASSQAPPAAAGPASEALPPTAPVPSREYPPPAGPPAPGSPPGQASGPHGPIFRLPDTGWEDDAAKNLSGANGDRAYDPSDATRVEPGGAAGGAGAAGAGATAAMASGSAWAPPSQRARITPPPGTGPVDGDDDIPDMPRHGAHSAGGAHDNRKRTALLAGVPIALLVVMLLAWAIDSAAASGKVNRGVEVAGHDVGGMKKVGVDDVVSAIADDTGARKVTITSGDKKYESTAADLGLTVDKKATADAILDETGGNPITWAKSFFTTSDVPVKYKVNEGVVALKMVQLQGADLTAPAEPVVALAASGEFTVTPGRAGSGVDAEEVAADLPAAAATDDPDATIKVDAPPTDVTPKFSDDQAQALATQANEMTANGLNLKADQTSVRVEPAQLRKWIGPAPVDNADKLTLAVNADAVNADLLALFQTAGLSSEPVDAKFDLQNGTPVVVPGKNGVSCCGDDAADKVWTALQGGKADVALEATVVEPDLTTDEANALGIKQAVGGNRGFQNGSEIAGPGPGFTTFHDPGQPRVTNIHRMADIVRGTVVLPGDTFSINDVVGERTTAKGFVPAGAIAQGHHREEVGGGVSQFATTTFNAAYFAGLDITEYQAHSEYFTRYPPGREATMGYPSPDLKFVNNTPYGIMVWTSYTGSSLTVTLYSTPYGAGEQTGKSESMSGQCRVVTTTRTVTFPDGHKTNDQFKATYRPGEGIGCDGQPIAPPPET